MTAHLAVFPPRGAPVSLASFGREMAHVTRAVLAPPPFPADAARGNGQKVIVLPGFGAKDFTTARLREFLAAQGFDAMPWPCGVNLGPGRNVLPAVERQLIDTAAHHGKVALIGISLGGTIAREIAHRRPAHVSQVITLGSPIRLPVVSPLAPLAQAAAMLWSAEGRASLGRTADPLPVPLTAIVSPMDGVVDWRSCLPDARDGETVIVQSPHTTMSSDPRIQRVIADRLARSGG